MFHFHPKPCLRFPLLTTIFFENGVEVKTTPLVFLKVVFGWVFEKNAAQDVWPRFLQWRTLWASHLLLCKVPWRSWRLANGKGGQVALNFPTPNGGEFSKWNFLDLPKWAKHLGG